MKTPELLHSPKMEPPKVCRICLNPNSKMGPNDMIDTYYKEFIKFDLITEKWQSVNVDVFSMLPRCICYECSALLIKSREFQHKCLRSFELLTLCMHNGGIPLDKVKLIDRAKHKLTSNIQYMENNDRVKIIFQKVDCDDELDITCESTFSIIHQPVVVSNNIKNDLHFDSVNDDELTADESTNGPNYIKLEFFENHLDGGLLDDGFEDFSQNDDFIIAEPLKAIRPDTAMTKKVKSKAINRRSSKRGLKKEKASRINRSKRKRIERDENKNKSENVEADQNCQTENKMKKRRVKSEMREMKFDESKWRVIRFTEEEAEQKFEERREDSYYKTAPFKCELCLKGFSSENILKTHQQHHNEDRGRHICKFCKMRFSLLSKLNQHNATHYHEYNCLQCPFVGRTLSGAQFHEEMHDGKGYTCETCNENFKHKSTFYTHMRVTHRSSYVCGVCGESYVTSKGLATHKARAHRIYTPRKVKRPKKSTKVDKLEDGRYCKECNLNFETLEAYNVHLLSATNHAVKSEESVPSQVQEVKTEEKYVPYKCYRPKRVWRGNTRITQSDRLELVVDASRARNYRVNYKKATSCKLCGENFTSVKMCIAHHRQAHPRVPYYAQQRIVCDVCGASIQAGQLKIHMNKHTKKIQYPCSVCSRVFYIKETMKRHMLTHTGEKPWACTLCDKTYQQVGSLRLHERTIHQRLKPPPRRRRTKNGTTTSNPFTFGVQDSTSI